MHDHADRARMNGLTLPSLTQGETAVVACVDAARGSAKRLADLGFIRGAVVEMIRAGSPCIVRIDGTRVGMGRHHQTCIQLGSE